VIQGAIFVVTVLLFRRGIVGELLAFSGRWWGKADRQNAPAGEGSIRPAE
jgi:hypothetical protein